MAKKVEFGNGGKNKNVFCIWKPKKKSDLLEKVRWGSGEEDICRAREGLFKGVNAGGGKFGGSQGKKNKEV